MRKTLSRAARNFVHNCRKVFALSWSFMRVKWNEINTATIFLRETCYFNFASAKPAHDGKIVAQSSSFRINRLQTWNWKWISLEGRWKLPLILIFHLDVYTCSELCFVSVFRYLLRSSSQLKGKREVVRQSWHKRQTWTRRKIQSTDGNVSWKSFSI